MFSAQNAGKLPPARGKMLRNWPSVAVSLLALLVLSAGAAMADLNVYEETGGAGFGTLDLNTGLYTSIGNSGILLSGLGEVDGVVYGGAEETNQLYSVNTSTGALTAVGGLSSVDYGDTGSTLNGLYAVGRDSYLYSINVSTGAATQIGYLGVQVGGTIGMSSNSATLYYTDNDNLYTINTTTGTATLVGATGSTIGAMVTENGTLFAGVEIPLAVGVLDPATAGLTVGPLEYRGCPGDFWGLVPENAATPEPGYWTLLGLGIAALILVRRRLSAA